MTEGWDWASLQVDPGATWCATGWFPTLQSGISGQVPIRLMHGHNGTGYSSHGAAFAEAVRVSEQMREAARSVLIEHGPSPLAGEP